MSLVNVLVGDTFYYHTLLRQILVCNLCSGVCQRHLIICSVAWIRTTPMAYETRMQPLHLNAMLLAYPTCTY